MLRSIARTLLAPLCLLAVACGGTQAPEVVVTPFTAEHEPVFENGLDMVRDPEALEGGWLASWEDELDRRVSLADVVALVRVRTVRQDTDLELHETFRLIADVEQEYLGELGDEVTFSVSQGDAGYGTVESNERHLLDRQFFAFVKWQRRADGTVRARWHLSPASDDVARRVRALLSSRRQVREDDGTRRRVVVHRN